MRPIPIPDECVGEGMKRFVVAAPDGDMTNEKVTEDLGVCQTMLVALEPGEFDRLAEMERPAIWLSMYTRQIPVFSVEVADGRG